MTEFEQKIIEQAKKIRSELYDIGQAIIFIAIVAILFYLRGCK